MFEVFAKFKGCVIRSFKNYINIHIARKKKTYFFFFKWGNKIIMLHKFYSSEISFLLLSCVPSFLSEGKGRGRGEGEASS